MVLQVMKTTHENKWLACDLIVWPFVFFFFFKEISLCSPFIIFLYSERQEYSIVKLDRGKT